MIDDDVASLASGLSSNNTLHRNDLADMRFFCLERIQGHGRHIIVRVSLQEVLPVSVLVAELKVALFRKCGCVSVH